MSTIEHTVSWQPLSLDRRIAWSADGNEASYHARPHTGTELAQTLAEAVAEGFKVMPVGGGTQLALGNPPSRVDLIVETTALDQVVEYEPADLTITVQAGIRLEALQELLRPHRQFLALDPPLPPRATIGGIVATNASGPLRYAYGTARDLVLGTRVANTDGRVTHAGGKVVKNVAGYDLNKLHVGGLGTLGVLVELSFKLTPLPETFATVLASFDRVDQASAAIAEVVHSPLAPLAIELLTPAAAVAAGLSRSWSLVLRIGGYLPTVERQTGDLRAVVRQHQGQGSSVDDATWQAVVDLQARPDKPVRVKAAVPPSASGSALELLERELGAFEPLGWSHAGSGVAYASLRADGQSDTIREALRQARSAIQRLGSNASLVVEVCPTDVKRGLDVWGDPGNGVDLMRRLKLALDPAATLNPGRYVGGI